MSRKSLLLGGGALVLLGLIAFAFVGRGEKQQGGRAGRGAQGKPIPVKVVPAARGDVELALDVIGRVEAASTVTMRARISGQLETLEFEPGQKVKRGQVLARIDTSLLEAQLKQAQAVLQKDDAQLVKARADVARYGEIAVKGYVSKIELDQYHANLAIAEAVVKQDKAAVELARTQLSYAVVTAPFDGVAGAPLAYPGAMVAADQTDLLVINQVQPVNVAFSVPEASLGALKKALAQRAVEVEARVQGDERALSGAVTFVDNAVDQSTGTIVMKASFANPDGALTPGQFVNVRLPTTRIPDAVNVPVTALQNSPTGPFVFVLRPDGTVEQRGVTTGPTADKRLVIEQGLAQGEQVVIEGQLLLVPGAKATVAGGEAPKQAEKPRAAKGAE